MPKLKCPCGFIHDLSPIPDDGWITIRDKDYEQLVDTEVELHQIHPLGAQLPASAEARYDQLMGVITGLHGLLYRCPECGRIMWKADGSEEFRVYVPEP